MPRHEDKRGAKSRVERLSALFLQRLHEIAGSVYATGLSSGAIRPEEMEAEIQRLKEEHRREISALPDAAQATILLDKLHDSKKKG